MFTGIIESIAKVEDIKNDKGNLQITYKSSIAKELKVDQSVCHDGACLTIIETNGDHYTVDAIAETISRTNLADLKIGDGVNIERSMAVNSRFDGHIVQGHIDEVGVCKSITENGGSWIFEFEHSGKNITVEKGSITVNGVSLTIVKSQETLLSVAIIPYTYNNTNFCELKVGSKVNLEFDILGKYISKLIKNNKTL
ncbi:MAG: riboflavin synthase [Flavobacteriales bacterium]|jgi:riboflavin synthase|nr:riboflavin synthase [Flavobacteriales bacterium]|tara:strand:- start:154 stop:744 length:591 start_codon:yes stop_codon:yes gene_type:complete